MMAFWNKRFFGLFGGISTQYQPGANPRIVAANSLNATAAGTNITESVALTIPAFYHSIRLYGQVLGSLDFEVVEQLDRGTRVAREHPVHRLLRDEPNEFQTASAFWATLIGHAVTFGNGFAFIARNGNLRPTALIPLLPDRTYIRVLDGRQTFVTNVNGETVELQPSDVFHLPGFSLDGIQCVPLVRLMADALGLNKAEEQYAAAFFANGCSHGGIVEVPGTLTPAAMTNLQNSMSANHGGIANAFRTLFLEQGMKFTPVGVDPDKSQVLASRQFSLVSMAQIVGLSPHLLFDLSRATFSNIEHLGIEAVNFSFRPWTKRIEQEANRKLLYESEKFAFSCRMNLAPLTQGDSITQANVAKLNFDMCALTPNNRREQIGLNALPGLDEPFLNTAYLPLSIAIAKALAAGTTTPAAIAAVVANSQDSADEIAEEQADQTTNNDPPADPTAGNAEPDGVPGPDVPSILVNDVRAAEALRPIVLDVVARLTTRDGKAITNARKRHASDPQAFDTWLASYQQETRSIVADSLRPVASSVALLTGRTLDVDALATLYVASIDQQEHAANLANQIIGG